MRGSISRKPMYAHSYVCFLEGIWVCLKIVHPYTQWLMIIIPTKWLFHWEYTPFSDIPIYFVWLSATHLDIQCLAEVQNAPWSHGPVWAARIFRQHLDRRHGLSSCHNYHYHQIVVDTTTMMECCIFWHAPCVLKLCFWGFARETRCCECNFDSCSSELVHLFHINSGHSPETDRCTCRGTHSNKRIVTSTCRGEVDYLHLRCTNMFTYNHTYSHIFIDIDTKILSMWTSQ